MAFKISPVPVTAGNQRSAEQQEIDEAAKISLRDSVTMEDLVSNTEEAREAITKRLDSAANLLKCSRKVEWRYQEPDENGEIVVDENGEAKVVCAFLMKPRRERAKRTDSGPAPVARTSRKGTKNEPASA
jgi:hypothetical protein